MGKKSKKKGSTRARTSNGGQKKKVLSSNAWKVGDRAVVCGLKQATRFNGKTGTIISEPKDSGSRYGISIDGHKVAVLPSNLKSSTESVHEYPYEAVEKMREEEADTMSMNISSMAAMRLTMNMMTEDQQIKKYGRKIEPLPDFRHELRSEYGGFPKGVDPNWANRHLRLAFELGAASPHTHEMQFRSPNLEINEIHLLKRIATNDRAKLYWYYDPTRQQGDIYPQMVFPYPTNIRHSYSNQAYKRETLLLGTTHVAVGFVDLGILLEADLADPPKRGMDGPLCFLGVESSPYAVAKTLVVWEMIRQSQNKDHVRYVLQVWFSTTIEAKAEQYLKKILRNLCDSDEKRHPKVDALLHHWKDADKMSVGKARSLWASRRTCGFSFIAHFEKKQDRIDMTKYELTGGFGIEDDGNSAYGNVIMFDCPEGTPPLFENETVFSAMNLGAITSSISPDTTIFEASLEYLMKGLSKVACWARQNMVTINLVCDDVRNVIDMIAATDPWTMSWSNVLDYMDYADFHRLARACSILGNTVHSGYSMNWLTNVWGVHIIDYAGRSAELRGLIIKNANGWVDMFYKSFGWEKYLRLPPPNCPSKSTSFLLETDHSKKWAGHFFGIGRRRGPCHVAGVYHASISPLSHTGSNAIHFGWTYNPEIEVTKQDIEY